MSGATTLTPKQAAYKETLASVADMTEADMAAAVAELPESIRVVLAAGPLPGRFACGVCNAFGESFYRGEVDLTDPRWRAWIYHEIPKLGAESRSEIDYGPRAQEIFDRCRATYRAAAACPPSSEGSGDA